MNEDGYYYYNFGYDNKLIKIVSMEEMIGEISITDSTVYD